MTTRRKPRLDDYLFEDGSHDFESFDFDLAIYEMDNMPPDLTERWCPELAAPPAEMNDTFDVHETINDILKAALGL
jgi:hypothetical protein